MPEAGLEPARSCPRGILSPLRLPIPPLRHLEAPHRIELWMRVLQTRALPLGYGATLFSCVFYKKPLFKKMERKTRFELATFALARQRSTTEPLPHLTVFTALYMKFLNKSLMVEAIGLEPMTPCL